MTASHSIFATIIAVLIASANADERPSGDFSSLTLRGHEGWVSCVAVSPDGRRIITGGHDETIRVWDLRSGKSLMTLRGGSEVTSVASSPDGRFIVAGTWDKTLKVWDANSGKEQLTLRGHAENVTSVAFSSDGRRIASGSGDDSWMVWDAASGKQQLSVTLDDEYDVTSVAFSPDGRRLATGDGEGRVRIWDAAGGDELLTLQGHAATVTSTAFSPNGKQIASGSQDDVIKIWDATRGQERLTLRGHKDDVTSVVFSPDGNRLASGSDDDTVRVWDVQTGKELLNLRGHTDNVTSVAFSPDGKQIVSTSKDIVIVWRPYGAADYGNQQALNYHAHILPLLKKHCIDCHGAQKTDGDFRVDAYSQFLKGGESGDPAVIPGDSKQSPLVKYLTGEFTPRMPKKRKALSDSEITMIRRWIDQGAIEGEPPRKVSFSEEQLVFFESNIRPLLAKHCFECHGENKANGNLAFTSREDLLDGGTRGPAIVPGKPDASLLIEAVRHSGKLRMPKNKPKLDDMEIALLEKWIAMDAPWPPTNSAEAPKIRKKFAIYDSDRKHWSFQPVVRPEIPQLAGQEWCCDDLDRFIFARLKNETLTPAPQATRRVLMRRLSFDLTGLPPTLEDLREFADSDSKSTLSRYVDKLIDSEDFGTHWARHWLDHVRHRPSAKKTERDDPYRRWVAKAFNDDMPYHQFLRMQIAGDLLPAERPDEVHLDGLIAVRPWSLKSRHHQQIDLLGRTFMGLSLFCARCHDHKLEPISRDDYFAIQGIFESSQVVKVPFLKQRAQFDEYMTGLARTQANETRMKKELKKFSAVAGLVDLRARIESERKKLDDPKQNKEKVQQNIDKLMADEKKRLADIEKKEIDLDAPEAREYMKLKQENNEFATRWKDVYQLDAFVDQTDAKKIGDAAPPKLGAEAKSGEPPQTDPPVPRRFPTMLAGVVQTPLGKQTKQSGRLELANWLADAKHPITARLITNRIWYYLLGEGLVPSLSNFGRSGRSPSHPELLDYLSDELVKNNWSMKQLIRRIVLSSTYQQTSKLDVSTDELDRREQLFGVARRKRLEVESIWRTLTTLEYSSKEQRRDPPADMMSEMRLLFDGANRDLIVPRRTASVSPLQALFLMNSEHVKASTERITLRLYKLPDDSRRIKEVFLLLYGRESTNEEIETGIDFLSTWEVSGAPENTKIKDVPPDVLAKWRAYLQVLLLTNEFLFVD